MKKLEDKVAVVYADGGVAAAIAKAFSEEGAKVYLTGRTPAKLEKIANAISSSGGVIETAQLDALDEGAVEKHMEEIIQQSGRIDISFNAIGIAQTGVQGIALTDLSVENFMLPVKTYTKSHFITVKAAAKRMVQQGNGVIMMHTANASRISHPFVGGMAPAWSAVEALSRSLSVEYAPRGVRSVCLLTTGMPETPLLDEVYNIMGKTNGISSKDFYQSLENMTQRRKSTTLKEFAAAAVFAASDDGAAITGSIFNLTAGMIVY